MTELGTNQINGCMIRWVTDFRSLSTSRQHYPEATNNIGEWRESLQIATHKNRLKSKQMSNKFGFLSKLDFLQDFASVFIASLNPAVVHNLEKYMALKKVHYLSAIESIEGDYLEFGVFNGSSFCHSIRCYKNQDIL